ncbi:IcmT/TraK family protein [Roseomonas sp. E05]|uniref:IcmT/TraK family protein n=1 Tax=Roseomonas sp. E05 TaxID=3046310 RepID=UPI0024B88B0B|nr:IcmT/TraK family protein [Roseomonas sp. E05]MDJ0390696.1 IcmT/TraK family protein [Roseomonas sp. E05]
MWRYTSLPVRVAILDARACIPMLVYVVYWSWTTASIAIAGTLFFTVISWFGLTLPAVFRVVRRWLVGRVRPAVPAWQRRRLA